MIGTKVDWDSVYKIGKSQRIAGRFHTVTTGERNGYMARWASLFDSKYLSLTTSNRNDYENKTIAFIECFRITLRMYRRRRQGIADVGY